MHNIFHPFVYLKTSGQGDGKYLGGAIFWNEAHIPLQRKDGFKKTFLG